MDKKLQNCAEYLRNGKIGVIPTDTIYGISASIYSPKAIERIYKITSRNIKKPFIILISSIEELKIIGIKIPKEKIKKLQKFWPGKISVIFPLLSQKLKYLHRGKQTLAVRLPQKENLRKLLQKTGPLISTSANPEGKNPARNIREAKNYFGNNVDFYFDEEELANNPSMLIDFTGEEIKIIKRKK